MLPVKSRADSFIKRINIFFGDNQQITVELNFFSSFGQMIRPMIDSVSVRPSGGTSISPTPSTSTSRAPESIFEPRNSPPGKTKQREPPDGW